MKKVLKIFSNLLLIVLLSAAAVFAVPRLFGIEMYGVLTGSMEPAYQVGELIYVVPTDEDDIEVGDVITFLMDDSGTVATHRVVEIDEENSYFYTKGDANDVEDGTPVHYNNVIGVVRFGIPFLGYAAVYMSTSSGKIITVTAVIAALILVVLFDLLSRVDAEELEFEDEDDEYDEEENARLAYERRRARQQRKTKEKGAMKKPDLGRLLFRYDPDEGFVRRWEGIGEKVARLGKRLHSIPLALIVPLALITAVTLMYLTAVTNTETNAFSIGTAGVVVDEPDIDPDEVEWTTTSKPVYLRNTGNVDGVVRAMIVPVMKDDEGNVLSGNLGNIEEAPTGTELVLGDITLHFADDWADNWFFQDGYFYYRKVLEAGDSTTKLLAGVTLTDEEKGLTEVSAADSVTVTIEVFADILQTEGSALAEWGVTVDENGAVTPTGS